MNIYERLIENPLFFKWVYHSSAEIEDYWKSYMKLNPQEAGYIANFKKEFEKLRYSTEKLPEEEKKALALKILRRLDLIDRQRKQRRTYIYMLRYAAIAILFFASGALLVYFQTGYKTNDNFVQNFEIPTNNDEPVLILDHTNKIALKEKESVLDYTTGNIILNGSEVVGRSAESEASGVNQLIIPYGNRSQVRLSDGTTVWLNAGSRLIYPSKFTGKRREVLLSGEAFFDVHRNPDLPFIVQTESLDIRVLGTKFNISAYPGDSLIRTVLEKGSVAIRLNRPGWFDTDLELRPNQMAVYNKGNKKTKVFEVNSESYSSWIQGLVSFENANLEEILKQMERYYHVRFHFNDLSKKTGVISGKLDLNEGLDEALGYLETVAGIKFKPINGNAYEIN